MTRRRFGRSGSELREIVLAAVEVRLQDGADAVEAVLAQPAVDAERRVDERRLLHVDADERVEVAGVLDEPLDVPVRELLVELEPEMGELEGDVRAQPLVDEPGDHVLVLGDDDRRLGLVARRSRRGASCSRTAPVR